jgi:hypothetical protein
MDVLSMFVILDGNNRVRRENYIVKESRRG